METLKELLELVKQTPEMALWALLMYFLFILLKLSSWLYTLKFLVQLFLKRFFDYKEKSLNNKRGIEIMEMFENDKITGVESQLLIELLNAVKKSSNSSYLHESSLRVAINKILKD